MKKKFVIFDFDGVMVDSFDIAYGINRRIIPELSEEQYRKGFEGNINVEMKKIAEKHSLNQDEFFDEYAGKLYKRKVVAGVPNVLKELCGKYQLIIISSTITSIIEHFLEKYGLLECFTKILGNDVSHSKVEKFKKAFTEFDFTNKDCVFVTDTLGDIREANEVGVSSIGVTWGVHPEEKLKIGKPMAMLSDPKDIILEIEKYFKEA